MEHIIQWLECCLRKYIDSIETEEMLSVLKNNLAEQTAYSEQQIYQNAFYMEQNQNNSFFVIMTCLTQNDIQRFAASIAFLPQYSTKYGYLFSKLHGINMPFPTVEMVWQIYNSAIEKISYCDFLSQLYTVTYELLFETQSQNNVFSEQALILKKELVYFVLTGIWQQNDYSIENTSKQEMLANRDIWQSIQNIQHQQKNSIIVIKGQKGSGKKFIAQQYAYEYDNVFLCCEGENANKYNILHMITAAMIQKGVICIQNCQSIVQNDFKEILLLLQKYHSFFSAIFLLGEGIFNVPKTAIPQYHFETKQLTITESIHFWKYFLKDKNISAEQLANKMIMTQGQIKQTVLLANQKVISEKCEYSQKLIEQCCTYFQSKYLTQKATKIKTTFLWEQLILPQEQKQQLRQICNRVLYEHIVYDEWGYDALLPYGRGVCMLFAGKSGTGKTMAAQVIAKELGLQLYRVDMSQIVSKYIGETEKNINSIFDEAMKSNIILLFDEMESLFGKRIDVKSANDRYTNMEVAFLLQKMENYKGISILATNHLEQIDTAFFRRIQYVVQFPFPQIQQRYELWKSFITNKVPLEEDIDFQYLAEQFEMTGGSIKNAMLTALFLAASQKQKCGMVHILKGVKQELQKQGKVLLPCDFGKYENLF